MTIYVHKATDSRIRVEAHQGFNLYTPQVRFWFFFWKNVPMNKCSWNGVTYKTNRLPVALSALQRHIKLKGGPHNGPTTY